MNFPTDDPEGQARLTAFKQALPKLGWTEGRNLHIDIRWAADDRNRIRQYAEELVALSPDAIIASASASLEALRRLTRSVPIVFTNVIDPVGAGFINSMARPGGNLVRSNTASAANGSNCSRDLHRLQHAWLSFAIQTSLPGSASSPRSSPRRRQRQWS
jgi:ABC-type uncharacterized transport system substrate-binding protein